MDKVVIRFCGLDDDFKIQEICSFEAPALDYSASSGRKSDVLKAWESCGPAIYLEAQEDGSLAIPQILDELITCG